MRTAVATAAALATVGAAASGAAGAVKQSTYTVTKITQTSSVTAALGSSSWSTQARFTYTARPGSNRLPFDFPTDMNFDAFTKGGTNPDYGVLQGVFAQKASQAGTVANSSGVCALPADVPQAERELTVRFYRTGTRAKKVYVEVWGPNAIARIQDERDGGRMGCLPWMPSLGTIAPRKTLGDQYQVSFAVPRAKFRRSMKGRKTLVVKGTKRTPLAANDAPAGELVVTTRVTLRLIGSR